MQVVLYTWGEELHMMVDSWLGESVGQVLNWYSSKGYQLARISSSVMPRTPATCCQEQQANASTMNEPRLLIMNKPRAE